VNPRLRIYGLVVGGIFWVALLAGLVLNHGVDSFSKMAPLVALAVAGEELVVRQRERGGAAAISFSAVAHVGAALLLSPLDAATTAALGILIADGLRSDSRRFLLINSAMFGISTWAAAEAYHGLGGGTAHLTPRTFLALTAVLAVRYAITTSIFCGGIALSGGGPFFGMLAQAGIEELGSAAGEGSLGVLVAAGVTHDTATLPFLLPLFAALYASKANLERLRTETQRALNAMADVIDARDPSTTAHSERVADYVAQLVEALRLPPDAADQLIATGRYHDLGKIAVDVRTLTSAERLNDAETNQIRQHPRLSAQLLRPFSFARDMAEFAELHHERFDGCGYYGVGGQSLPIEAHVLIVVDSFDAMTSDRPYRPALTKDEALKELLDKSGTQFHPLVARAFVAVLSGETIESRLSSQEISLLKSQFRRPRTASFRLPALWQPRPAFLASILIALGLAGLRVAPAWVYAIPLSVSVLSATAWAWTAAQLRRRRRRAEHALERGLSADTVLSEAGLAGSAGWLSLNTGALPSALPGLSSTALAEVQSWALRRHDASVVSLTSGATVVFSGATKNNCHYVLVLIRPPRRRERELVEWIAAALAAAAGQPPAQRNRVDDKRSHNERRAVALVALECFERVRRGAGQLVAERIVGEVERELRATLRQNDAIIRLDEDTFGISALVTDLDGLDQLETRIARAIAAVKLPARLAPLTPRIVADTPDGADAIPELAAIEAKLLPGSRSSERVQ
jgi:GGDEF domain-containing protein